AALERSLGDNHRPSYLATLEAIVDFDVLERAVALGHPCRVVTGDRDYTPVERKREYVERMRRAELVVIPDSGHATPIDQPTAFGHVVLEFLDRVDAAAETNERAYEAAGAR